jgi:hypothetical protein
LINENCHSDGVKTKNFDYKAYDELYDSISDDPSNLEKLLEEL